MTQLVTSASSARENILVKERVLVKTTSKAVRNCFREGLLENNFQETS